MRWPRLLLLLLPAAASGADAQQLVVSPGPDSVTVTVYRAPKRAFDQPLDNEWELDGYALITEVRSVDLPAGPAIVRFEGVASGIKPESAIMRGIDPREKNQDRRLLSERGLLDAYTGQSVTVRRTNCATGKVVEEPARLRSGPNGVVIETAAGFEALHCDGTARTLLYPGVPAGLSAKPVLSMTTSGQSAGRQRIELSYLTSNMDWDANYVAELDPDARSADLLAWLTIASHDDTSFVDAQTLAVAGEVARARKSEDGDDDDDDDDDEESFVVFENCWPAFQFSPETQPRGAPVTTVGQDEFSLRQVNASEGVLGYVGDDSGDIVVTGTRIARHEDIGDLKLYRIPSRVTVASQSQKQAAFLAKSGVKGELVYRSRVYSSVGDPEQVFRMRNLASNGLGVPLPGGRVNVFQSVGGRRMLLGEASFTNKAVGEDVELVLADSTTVDVDTDDLKEGKDWVRSRLTVTNANPWPIAFEAEFQPEDDARFDDFSRRTFMRKGKRVWAVTVPAEGKAELVFRRTEIEIEDED